MVGRIILSVNKNYLNKNLNKRQVQMAKATLRINAINETEATFNRVNKRLDGMKKAAVVAGKVLASLFIIRGAARFIGNLIQTGDQLQKMAIQTGATVEALSQLQFAVRRSGVSVEALASSLLRMRRRIGLAAKETGAAKEALKQLGLSAVELAKLKTEDQLEIIAGEMVKIKDETIRAAFAFEIFGTQGQRLLPLLDSGSKGIQELRRRADELGLTMSTTSAEGFAKAADATLDMQVAIQGLVRQLTVSLGPTIAATVNFIRMTFQTLPDVVMTSVNLVLLAINKLTISSLKQIEKVLEFAAKAPSFVGRQAQKSLDALRVTLASLGSQIITLNSKIFKSVTAVQFVFKGATVDSEKLAVSQKRTAELTARVFDINIKKAAEMKLALKSLTSEEKEAIKIREAGLARLTAVTDAWKDRTVDAFMEVRDKGSAAFTDLVSSILQDITRVLIKKNIVEPIAGSLSGIFGGALGSLFGAGGTPTPLPTGPGALPKPFAAGGRPQPGKVALVGEEGPELFRPDTAGTVIPNSALGGGGGTSVTIEIINESSTPIQAKLGNLIKSTEKTIQQVVITDFRRGGPISKALATTFDAKRSSK